MRCVAQVFDFSTKYCLVILAGLVPIITLGIGDPGLGVLVVGKILIMYMGYLVLFARASKTWSDSLTGRWCVKHLRGSRSGDRT